MQMYFNILLIICFLFANSIVGQDLHIYHNVHSDSTWYIKNGKPVHDLKVRKGKNVYFHLVEYNNYIYKASFDVKSQATPSADLKTSIGKISGLMPNLLNSFIPGGNIPFMEVPVIGKLLGILSNPNPDGTARGQLEEVIDFKQNVENSQQEIEAINEMVRDINKREKAVRILSGNMDFINTMSKTSFIEPSSIKELIMSVFDDAFMLDTGQSFQVKDIEDLNDKLTTIPQLRNRAKERLDIFGTNLVKIEKKAVELKTVDHGIDDLYPILIKLKSDLPLLKSMVEMMDLSLSEKRNPDDGTSSHADYSFLIQNYFIKYLELSKNDFAYSHHIKTDSKMLIYTLKLFTKDSVETPEKLTSVAPFKTLSLEIETYGDIRFLSSVGLSGCRYDNTPQHFIVKNNVITAVDEDRYVPIMCSFFNFSYSFGSVLTPAISFGMGLPLNTSENTGLTLFLGPGIYIGRTQNLMINGGYMFSKITQLSNGLRVGDNVSLGDGILPVEKKFGKGLFLGLSYKIGG